MSIHQGASALLSHHERGAEILGFMGEAVSNLLTRLIKIINDNVGKVHSLPFVNEAVRSLVLLSDLFFKPEWFDAVYDCLSKLVSEAVRDPILLRWVVVGMSKAVAVVHQSEIRDGQTSQVAKVLLGALQSSLVSTQMAGLHSLLYLLEGGIDPVILPVIQKASIALLDMTSGATQSVHILMAYSASYVNGAFACGPDPSGLSSLVPFP